MLRAAVSCWGHGAFVLPILGAVALGVIRDFGRTISVDPGTYCSETIVNGRKGQP